MLANATRWRGAIKPAKIDEPNFAHFDRKAGTELEVNFAHFCEPTDREISGIISCIPSAQKVDSILRARRTIVGVLSISRFHFRLHRSILIALENTRTIVPDDWRNSSSLARCERTGVKMILAQQVR